MNVLRHLALFAAAALLGVSGATADNTDHLVTNLPGLDNAGVNFKHYAGHLELQANEKLFYWYTESQDNLEDAPIVLWLNGGPGCSSMGGFFTENGPFVVNGDLSIKINRHSWNRKANMVWLESPAGVGFSGPVQDETYYNDDVTAEKAREFLQLFFEKYSELKGRKFYITGESYAGRYIPYLVNVLVEHPIPGVNLAGFAIGNAYTDLHTDANANIDYFYTHGLMSLESYREIQKECGREGIGCVFSDQEECSETCTQVLTDAVSAIQMDQINPYFIYGDVCRLPTNQVTALPFAKKLMTQLETTANQRNDIGPCADTFTQTYLNQREVQEAIHVPNQVDWADCSDVVGEKYTSSLTALPKYPNILSKGLKVLIFSGDADSNTNFIGTERWIGEEGLKLRVTDKWTAWFGPDKQLAGYVQGYEGLTFKTVKGAGHMVPAVKPLHGLNLFECFVFGDDACATFDYPKDEEEFEAGDISDSSKTSASSTALSAHVSMASATTWLPLLVVCSAIGAVIAIGAKNSKKRSAYERIGSSA
uniref:Carboxypeptidase n=1 Tax=Globisporangium ultimum (strain ATCC 200006 / CBS 805.95 / DAOM BR144) TaxID=431595 RepID=K3WZY1_GLOUD